MSTYTIRGVINLEILETKTEEQNIATIIKHLYKRKFDIFTTPERWTITFRSHIINIQLLLRIYSFQSMNYKVHVLRFAFLHRLWGCHIRYRIFLIHYTVYHTWSRFFFIPTPPLFHDYFLRFRWLSTSLFVVVQQGYHFLIFSPSRAWEALVVCSAA